MNLTLNNFMYWFSDHLGSNDRQTILADILSCTSQYPGEVVSFPIPDGGKDYLNFPVRLNIMDRSVFDLIQKDLKKGLMTTRPALWIDSSVVEKGAQCIINGQTVGLIVVRDVVEIDAGVKEFDQPIDTNKLKH